MKSTLCRTYFKCIRRDLDSTFALGLKVPNTTGEPSSRRATWSTCTWAFIPVVTHLFGTSNSFCSRTHPPLLFLALGPLFLLFILLFCRPILLNLTRGAWRLSFTFFFFRHDRSPRAQPVLVACLRREIKARNLSLLAPQALSRESLRHSHFAVMWLVSQRSFFLAAYFGQTSRSTWIFKATQGL